MHLTYHDSDTHTGTASTAKAEETGAPEMEVSIAMNRAGGIVLTNWAESRGLMCEGDWEGNLAEAVFLAMRRVEIEELG